MAWVRLDDAFSEHDKFIQAGPLASYLAICAIAWSNRNLKDGVVPLSQVGRLVNWDGIHHRAWEGEVVGGCESVAPTDLAETLVAVGLWEAIEGGYLIHDYLKYQPSAASIKRQSKHLSAARAEAGKRGGKARANRQANGKQTASNVQANGVAND